MLDFLPEKNKLDAIREYVLRLFVIFFFGLLIIFLVLIILFIPSIFYAKYKNITLTRQLESTTQNYSIKEDDPTKIIKNINLYTKIFDSGKIISIPNAIKDIASNSDGIRIKSFQISQNGNTLNFSISGVADSRESLTRYDKKLKENQKISNVILPVSSLIKSTDLDFNITFLYNQ